MNQVIECAQVEFKSEIPEFFNSCIFANEVFTLLMNYKKKVTEIQGENYRKIEYPIMLTL